MVLTMIHHIWPLSTIVNTNWHCEKGPSPRQEPFYSGTLSPKKSFYGGHLSRFSQVGFSRITFWRDFMDGSMDKHGGYIWEFVDLWWIYLGTIAVPRENWWIGIKWNEPSSWVVSSDELSTMMKLVYKQHNRTTGITMWQPTFCQKQVVKNT